MMLSVCFTDKRCSVVCDILLQSSTIAYFPPATRLYLWLLNPVGGEEHSTEMMHSTEVNLLLHGFLPDPEHFEREKQKNKQKNCQQPPGSCTIPSYSISPFFVP